MVRHNGAMTTLVLTWVWPDTAIAIFVVLAGALLGRWLILRGIAMVTQHTLARAQARRAGQTSRADRILAMATGAASERHEQRTATIASLLKNLTSLAMGTLIILTVLAILDVPLAPLLASAGVGGIAIAFGAQSLVKDFLSGIFMILEDQYGVGDVVNTGEVTGTVQEVGLRVTRLRDSTGQIWYVRNGEILRVGNQSQGWSTAIIDVPVAYDEDAAKVISILDEVATEIDADPALADVLLERPTVAGVNAVTGGTMTVRVTAKTAPNQHWGVQRTVLERSVTALTRAGVRGPAILPGAPVA